MITGPDRIDGDDITALIGAVEVYRLYDQKLFPSSRSSFWVDTTVPNMRPIIIF